MGSKKDRNKITLPAGKTIVMFDGPEDLSAMPRQQRRLRERLRAKEERKIWRAHQHGLNPAEAVDKDREDAPRRGRPPPEQCPRNLDRGST